MSVEQNVANANRIPLEMFNQGNLSIGPELFAPGYVDHAKVPPGLPSGLPGLNLFIQGLRAAFPDFQYTLEDVVAQGDKVVHRLTARGTQQGEFAGLPASGRTAAWEEIHISDWADGKLVEHWLVADQLGMLQQLGAIPVPASA